MRLNLIHPAALILLVACSQEATTPEVSVAVSSEAEQGAEPELEEGLVEGPGASLVTLVRGEPFRGVYPLIECVSEDCIMMMASDARENAARGPDMTFKPKLAAAVAGIKQIDLEALSPAYSDYDVAWRIGEDPEAIDILLKVIHDSEYWDEAPSFLIAQMAGFEHTSTSYSVLNYPNNKDNFQELFKLGQRMGPQPRVTVGSNGSIIVEEFGPDYSEPISSVTRYWAAGDHGEFLATREEMAYEFGETVEEIDAMLAAEE